MRVPSGFRVRFHARVDRRLDPAERDGSLNARADICRVRTITVGLYHAVVVVVRRLGCLIEGEARREHVVAGQRVAAAERGRDVGVADPVVSDHVGRRAHCRQQRDGEQQLLHGVLLGVLHGVSCAPRTVRR
eukprot:scaffold76755_cov63-Phaeocystis_antarctica.AAC.2